MRVFVLWGMVLAGACLVSLAAQAQTTEKPPARVLATPVTVPSTPVFISAEAGRHEITVAWRVADDGGARVSSHTLSWAQTGGGSSITVTIKPGEVQRISRTTLYFGVGEKQPTDLTSHEGVLYMLGNNPVDNFLYTLDPKTGIAQRVGNATDFGVNEKFPTGLASHGDKLYMTGGDTGILSSSTVVSVSTNGPYILSTETGIAEMVDPPFRGDFGGFLFEATGLASHGNVLYILGEMEDALFTLDLERGTGQRVGSTPGGFDVEEHEPTGLASHGGVLYMVGKFNDILYTLNPETGRATKVGPVGVKFPWGLASHEGVFYMVDVDTGALYRAQTLHSGAWRIDDLMGGTEYEITVFVANAVGKSGVASTTVVTLMTEPLMPQNVVAKPRDKAIDLTWDQPASDGGSALTTYRLSWERSAGGVIRSTMVLASVSEYTIMDLTNDVEYTITLSAWNAIGEGPPAQASTTPRPVPSTPLNVMAEPGNTLINLTWGAPALDSGFDVLTYKLSWNPPSYGAASSATVSATNYTITGLTNGQVYTVLVSAESKVGVGPPARVSATPVPEPSTPVFISAEAGPHEITVVWEVADDGGARVSSHTLSWAQTGGRPSSGTVTVAPGSAQRVGSATRFGVNGSYPTGLASHGGVLYMTDGIKNFLYTLNPATGRAQPVGSLSASMITGVPLSLASHEGVFYVGDNKVFLYKLNPMDPMGSAQQIDPPAGFGVSEFFPSGLASHGSVLYVVGLNKLLYKLDLMGKAQQVGSTSAGFGVGESLPGGLASHGGVLYMVGSAHDVFYTLDPMTGSAQPFGSPSAGFGVGEGDPSGLASHGGVLYMVGQKTDALHRVQTLHGGAWRIDKLTRGTEYGITASATNAVGESAVASTTVVTLTVPGVPEDAVATPMDKAIGLTWEAPELNGGSELTSYRLSWDPPNSNNVSEVNPRGELPASATNYTITGLRNGQAYTIKLSAWNDLGEGQSTELSAMPATVPGVPEDVVAKPMDKAIGLTWEAPANGGSELTSYRLSWDPPNSNNVSEVNPRGELPASATNYTITGLTNGQEYTVKLSAWNAIGEGPSTELSATPVGPPTTPLNVVAKLGNKVINLTWDEPELNGGSELTSYKLSWDPPNSNNVSEVNPRGELPASATNYTITDLRNGQEYTIKLSAWNDLGEGPSTELSATPATVPSMSVFISAEAGPHGITVAWRVADDGGEQVTSHTLNWAQTGGGPSSGTVTVAPGSAQRVGSFGINKLIQTDIASHGGVLYMAGLNGDGLYTLDPKTGRAQRVDSAPADFGVGEKYPTGLASHRGVLYLTGGDKQGTNGPYKLNPMTGIAKELVFPSGGFGGVLIAAKGLASHGNVLYLLGDELDALYKLDLMGNAQRIGSAPAGFGVDEIAPNGLTSHGGVLYMVGVFRKWLHTLNTETGRATPVGPVGVKFPWGLASHRGVLYMGSVLPPELYRLQTLHGGAWRIDGLTRGTEYEITVSAANIVGESGVASTTVVTLTVPSTPLSVVAKPMDKAIGLTWEAPANGGSELTSYRLSWDPPNSNNVSEVNPRGELPASATNYTITGLTNGQEYTITLSAWNDLGEGPSIELSATPVGPPTTPLNVVAKLGNKVINLTWEAPELNGGSELTSYKLSWNLPSIRGVSETTVSATMIKHTITGLRNGQAYTVKLSAWNAIGEGPSTELSATPAGPPTTPLNVVAKPMDKAIGLTWEAPANGGSELTSYRLSWDPPNSNNVSEVNPRGELPASATNYTITGLTNGQEYTITLSAWNDLGEGPSIELSATPVGPPTTPLNVVAKLGNKVINLTWEAPELNGGSELTSYKLSWNLPSIRGVSETTVSATMIKHTITGLRNGQVYTIKLSAWNDLGEGPSTQVLATPVGPPTTPLNMVAKPMDKAIGLTWEAPANGGSELTSYELSWNLPSIGGVSETTVSATMTKHTITGLRNGQAYTVKLSAWNAIGEGPSTELSATPVGPPTTPLNVVAKLGNKVINLTWEAPANGGSELTSYELSWNLPSIGGVSETTVSATMTKHTITGLRNGQAYTIKLSAWNDLGEGPSTQVLATPVGPPTTPLNMVAKPMDKAIGLTWEAPANGGSELTSYELSWNLPSIGGVSETTVSATMTKHTITGLRNGQAYTVKLSAWNAIGEGPSTELSATPAGPPTTPLNVVAKLGNKVINLTWEAPELNGGSELTSYKLSWDPPNSNNVSEVNPRGELPASATNYTITDLRNGQEYTIKLSAWNDLGEGPSTELSATPATVPSMSVFISAEAGPHGIIVAWRVADDGGEQVTSHTLNWAQTGGGPSSGTVTVAPGSAQRVGSFGINKLIQTDLASHGGVLYMAGLNGDGLYTLDPKTGRAQRVDSAPADFGVGEKYPTGLASHRGVLYLTGGDKQGTNGPYKLNPMTGIAKELVFPSGGFGGVLIAAKGLASHGNVLYLLGDELDALYKLDLMGNAQRIGSAPAGFGVDEIAPNGLTSHGGVLYMVGVFRKWLHTLNTETGRATPVGPVGVKFPWGLASHRGVLYMGSVLPPELYRLQTLHGGAWRIDGLTRGTEYEITVSAANIVGESGVASTTVVTLTVPSTPLSVVAKPMDKAIGLTWEAPANGGSELTSYRLSWDPPNSNNVSEVNPRGELPASATNYTITGLTNGQEYTITLSAWNDLGEGPSIELSATPVGPPTTPLNVVAKLGNKVINLTWEAPELNGGSELTSYKLSWNLPSIRGVSETTVSATMIKHTITGLRNGQAYTVKLSAWNDLGEGPSTQVLATPVGPPTTPLNMVAKPMDKAIGLTWEAPANGGSELTSYELSWNLPSIGGVSETTVSATMTKHTITGLRNGQAYTVKLSAWNAIGEGPSTELSATPAGPPTTPLNVVAKLMDKAIGLTWEAPANGGSELTSYRLSWDPPNSNNVSEVNPRGELPASATNYTITGLTNGQEYTITLSAWNDLGEGPSIELSATPVGPPTTPLNVVAKLGNKVINLTWEAPELNGGSELTSYKLSWNLPSIRGVSETTVSATMIKHTITGLRNGQVYTIKLSAWNDLGEGPSTQVLATPVGPPTTPLNMVAKPMDKAIGLTWEAPELNGGSELTSYELSWNLPSIGGVSETTVSATNYTITGLRNGQAYTVKLSAWNAIGEGPSTELSATPAGPPTTPLNVVAKPMDKAIGLTWEAPANGGSELTSYRLSWDPPNSNNVSEVNPRGELPASATNYTITGLTNGQEYTVKLSAWNAIGEGPSTELSATPVGPPTTPLNVMAKLGNKVINLTWDEPELNGGSELTSYKLSWDPPNSNNVSEVNPRGELPASATNYTITDLRNGQEYTIKLSAWNDLGEGPSTQVLATPVGPPTTPLNMVAKPMDKAIGLTWEAPELNGGSELTSYELSWNLPSIGGVSETTVSATMTKHTITGLRNGQAYTVKLSAWNAIGEGPSTELSATPAGPPTTPLNVVAKPMDKAIGLTWEAPANGGSELTSYRLSWDPPNSNNVSEVNPRGELLASATNYTITGLRNGQAYTVKLSAWNAIGEGPSTELSATPVGPPTTPLNVVAKPRNKVINLTWEAPELNGGSELTSYKLSWNLPSIRGVSETTVSATMIKHTITGLRNGQVYTIKLSAWNDLGEGPSTQVLATPVGPPTTPLNMVAKPMDKAIGLTWEAPANGGSELTSYELSWNLPSIGGVSETTVSATNYTITGLRNGQAYTVKLSAWNAIGEGPSTELSATPVGPPTTPLNVVAKPMDKAIGLTWEAPANGGSELTSYRLSWDPPNSNNVSEVNPRGELLASATNYTITGLRNGQAYTVKLSAWNVIGEGPSTELSATPVGPPTTPLNVVAKPRNKVINLIWDEPASDGGSELTSYGLSWEPANLKGVNEVAGAVMAPMTKHTITGLTNDEEYTITLSAWNDLGEGPSTQVLATPVGPPTTPLNVVAKPRNKVIDLTWDEPASNGGSELTSYRLSWEPANLKGVNEVAGAVMAPMISYTITGLTNDEEYTIKLSAWNDLGEGPSTQVLATPVGPPTTPLNVVAKPKNKAIDLTWNEPELNGGSELMSYKLSWNLSSIGGVSETTVSATMTKHTITGLTNGQEYTVKLSAWNDLGEGPSTELSATPVGPPTTPLNVVAKLGNKVINLTWDEPASNGGSELTSYRLSWEPANLKSVNEVASGVMAPLTSYTITGLTNDEEYTITLSAWNDLGEGPSTQVLATPVGPPTTPLNVMAKPKNKAIDLTWDEPASNGGSELTSYRLSWEPANLKSVNEVAGEVMAPLTSYTITGLTNGQEYKIKLSAWNDLGEGPSTELLATPATVPSMPLNMVAKPGNTIISLSWIAPELNGGFDVSSCELSWGLSAEGMSTSTTVSANDYMITGLTNGMEYTITLSARNEVGEGPPARLLATPMATVASTPQNVVAKSMNMAIGLTWGKPASDGGSDLTTYKLSWNLSSIGGVSETTVSATMTKHTITGLTNGQEYTVKLSAWNDLGEGPSTQVLATPVGPPTTPLNVVAKPVNTAISLTWEAPANGGSELTSYKLSWDPPNSNNVSEVNPRGELPASATNYTITGLTNGQEYTITLSAWNDLGEGPSTELSATPVGPPTTPLNVVAKPGNKVINLTWDEPELNGGSALTTYTLSWNLSSREDVSETTVSASVSEYTITGLTNGQEYTITLLAENVIGEGPSTELSATPGNTIISLSWIALELNGGSDVSSRGLSAEGMSTSTTVPSIPLKVVAVAGDTAIGLTWDKPASNGESDLTSYRVLWRISADISSTWSKVDVLAEHTAAVITGLANDVKHTILVSAWNAFGEGPSTEVFATPQSELDEDLDGVDIASTAGYVIVPGDLASGGAIIETSDLLPEGSRVCIIPEENSAEAIYCRQEQEAGDTIVVPAFESKLYGVTGERLISRRIYVAPVIGFSHGTQRCSPNGVNDEVNLDLRLSPTVANTIIGNSNSAFDLEFETVPPDLMATPEMQFDNTGILRVAFTPVEFTNEVKAISVTLATINAVAFVGDKESLSGVKEKLIRDKKLFALGNNKVTLLEPKESSTPLIEEVVVDNAAQHSTELITFNKRTTITFTEAYAVKVRRYSTETMILATDRSLSSTATKVVIDIAGSAPMITFDGSTPRGIAGSGSNIFEIVLSSGGESTGISVLGGVPTALSSADGEGGVTLATPRRGSVVRPGFCAYETSTVDRTGVSSPRITANTLNLQPLPGGRTVDDASSDFGVFDFIVSDLVCDVATVVLELKSSATTTKGEGWTYHKYQQGFDEDEGEWSPFVRMEQDKIFSAPAPCPPAYASREPDEGGSGSYAWHLAHDGIRNKDRCLLLEIEDGSVNDADGRVNRIISDPGALSEEEDIFGRRSGGDGGMDLWWLMLLLGGMVSGTALARRRSASRQKAGTDQPSCRFA